jgi:ASC-1-like (ASCH) protein
MKSWKPYFQAIKNGTKTHDLRKKDRDFKVGDKILLEEYLPFEGSYTGEQLTAEITYITSNDTPCAFSSAVLDNDYCILSLKVK